MALKCSRSWELFAALATLFVGTNAQLGPAEGLCQRYGHQSAIVGDKLVFMGGMRVVQDPTSKIVTEEPTNEFLSLDLGPQGTLFQVNKREITRPPAWEAINYTVNGAAGLPTVVNGGMFVNGEDLYIYEGRLPGLGPEASSSIWKYTEQTGVWGQELTWSHSDGKLPNRVSRGAGVTMGDRGVGVYVGGARIFINDTTTPSSGNWFYPSAEQVTTFDMRTLNRTTTALPDSQKRMGAALAYLPIGKSGAVIGIGGTLENDDIRESGSVSDIAAENFNADNLNFSPMRRVWIMDLDTRKWYSQSTFGTYIPDARMEHCISVVSAPDNSSHNIYMFGGGSGSSFLNHTADNYFQDLYILSLPSFRWIRKQFTTDEQIPRGRVQHSCHVYGKHMVVLGGATNRTEECSWDEINILDMTSLEWLNEYRYSSDKYEVPEIVMGSISNNGQVQTDPVNGWDDHDLEDLFEFDQFGDHDHDENNHNLGRMSGMGRIATIAGAVAGSILAVLCIAAGIFFWRKNRKQRKELKKLKASAYEASRTDARYTGEPVELQASPASDTTMDYESGYAHPGKLWRESYHSYELSESDLDPFDRDGPDGGDEDGIKLISAKGKIPTGYFELGDPSTPIERHELDSGIDFGDLGERHQDDDLEAPDQRGRARWR